MLWCRGQDSLWCKVGGRNTRNEHWYVSKLLAGADRSDLMAHHGFRWMDKAGGRHCWWQIDGANNTDAFQTVVEALTGVVLRGDTKT